MDIFILLIATVLFDNANAMCTRIQVQNYYCCMITCAEGEQPVPCYKDDERSADCKECPHGTFSSGRTRLGEACQYKRTCLTDHMEVDYPGSSTEDATCRCEAGYIMSNYVHACYRDHLPSTSTARPTTPTAAPPEWHPVKSSSYHSMTAMVTLTTFLPLVSFLITVHILLTC